MIKKLNEQNTAQLFRFALIGVLNTVIDFGVFFFLNKTIGLHYVYAQITGYSLGIVNSFVWNKYWTFNESQKQQYIYSQFGRFLFVNGLSLSITLLGLWLLIDLAHISTIIAKLVILIISQLVNFVGYKYLVFS